MNNLPIRFKLMLLAGVPVLGALCLSLVIVVTATEQMRKAESLGSVESLAELTVIISELVHELQMERALAALALGTQAGQALREEDDDGLGDGPDGPGDAAEAEDGGVAAAAPVPPASDANDEHPRAVRDALRRQFARTDLNAKRMEEFLAGRDLSRLPDRLSVQLRKARDNLEDLTEIRTGASTGSVQLQDVTEHYEATLSPLIESTAALTELVDDGALLRVITLLVSLMKVKEADSAEHAVVAHALSAGEFAPGAYRQFVSLTTAGESYADMFHTLNTIGDALALASVDAAAGDALAIRELVSAWIDGPPPASARRWFDAQANKVVRLHALEGELNTRVRGLALSRIADTRRALGISLGLAGVVLFVSVVLGWYISFGVSRSVDALRLASERIGHGDLQTRFVVRSEDELGQLGAAFNEMARELSLARQAEAEQARMAGELEIAARLQSALLPPHPQHDGFEFAGRMIPAEEVGGDFYDVLSQGDDGALWLTIGDVSNHGLDSGLVMLMAQAAFSTQFQANAAASADSVIRGVNHVLWDNITRRLKDNKYLTAQVWQHRGGGQFDCAGGHEPPVIFRKATGKAEVASAIGPWLGIMSRLANIPVTRMELHPGDVLCLYSDGVTEAKNEAGELFDTERLAIALADAMAQHDNDLEAAADAIIERVEAHANGRDDDWTFLLVRRCA